MGKRGRLAIAAAVLVAAVVSAGARAQGDAPSAPGWESSIIQAEVMAGIAARF